MPQLLLFEYLHADADAWHQAPSGMRREGYAMLRALLDDALAERTHSISLVLCEDAVPDFSDVLDGTPDCRIHRGTDPFESLQQAAEEADVVLPVAPESDGLLMRVSESLRAFRERTLLPHEDIIRICSDKLLTWEHFRRSDVPMIDCLPASGQAAATDATADGWIFKPRLGAGCDGIQHGSLPTDADPNDYIRQRCIPGRSLSVGLLGSPDRRHVLPAAEQLIEWNDEHPVYLGGTVPADVCPSVQQQIDAITCSVIEQLGPFRGYVGLDLLLADADNTVWLNEINPRLCTSYLGYRRLLTRSPLSVMLSGSDPATLTQHQSSQSRPVCFSP